MRLRLEIYKEVLILNVEQSVSARGVEVLNAGFDKLYQQGVEWILVDLTRAEATPEAKALAIQTRGQLKSPKIKGIFFVGPIAGLCDFATMEVALNACPSPEAALLKEKVRLEKELALLKKRKEELDAKNAANTALQSQRHTLLSENENLQELKTLMEKEIESCIKEAQRDLTRKEDPKATEDLGKVKDEILTLLKEAGVL